MKKISFILFTALLVITGCAPKEETKETTKEETKEPVVIQQTKGQEYETTLASTSWQGTKVLDENNNDLTAENTNFIGLAKYDETTGHYEFFNKETKETRGDTGIFFVTNDGTKRILISQTMNYQAIVDITELTNQKFTYKRMGKDATGADVNVFVEHIPYTETQLQFTTPQNQTKSEINADEILGATLWQGTKVTDAAGNDITQYNANFISIANFDEKTSKYEFFNVETGESKEDFGYFAIINNEMRAHVSIGTNKYGAVLKLTQIDKDIFTYTRMGKDADGNDIEIFVIHEPYTGTFNPTIGF